LGEELPFDDFEGSTPLGGGEHGYTDYLRSEV